MLRNIYRPDDNNYPSFVFDSNFNLLGTYQSQDSQLFKLTPIHYSLKNDKSAFSILAKGNDEEFGVMLISVVFIKPDLRKNVSHGSTKYNYLLGPGVKARWSSPEINIDLCTTDVARYYYAQKAIESWQDAFASSDTKMKFKFSQKRDYPPFSDLNSQCVYFVNNLIREADEKYSNMGTTFLTLDSQAGKIIDSDIIIWDKEINKIRNYYQKEGHEFNEQQFYYETIMHEYGHYLGLDHQFNPNVPSVMSYADTSKIRAYDIEAINELYR